MARIVTLPTAHLGQNVIYRDRTRRNAVRCGRRFGTTKMIEMIGGNAAAKGYKVGIFTPEIKQWSEIYDALEADLEAVKKTSDRNKGKFRAQRFNDRAGLIDCWAIYDNQLAGRGREYDIVLMDEAAFGKNGQHYEIWKKSIEPTLLTTRGSAWAFSTPYGIDDDNFFYKICTDKELGWKEFHAPSSTNPYVPPDELERIRLLTDPLVYQQEYLAEFVDWSGVQFFQLQRMLDPDNLPVAWPTKCDTVYAVVDTALKTGDDHDGTAVTYFAYNQYTGDPLVILDWDIVQIEGATLETWLPSVMQRVDDLAQVCGARYGPSGVHIEDKNSGTILLQKGEAMGWPTHAIDSVLTSLGKDGRALNISNHVYQGRVKISAYAHDKLVMYKGSNRNHFLVQVCGYKLADKDAAKREDDLFDTFTYGVAIGLGNSEGF